MDEIVHYGGEAVQGHKDELIQTHRKVEEDVPGKPGIKIQIQESCNTSGG